ncbi:MAG TPA: glutamate 5-kinase [Nitriliruptoraceae bacterium]|nr:glutamate 5-kinase [Nitriliruptoraceae bacterium]
MSDAPTRFPRPDLAVVKIGSSSLRGHDGQLDTAMVASLAEQVAAVRAAGTRVVLVSSGAVAAGMGLLGRHDRPTNLQMLQTCAAVGQTALINAYQRVFARHDLAAAQILLTQDDFVGRGRYLNARRTLATLLDLDVIPIINENDAIAFDELAWGDNDHLAALVASMLDADLLVVLSDVDGLYDRPPSEPDAVVVDSVADLDDLANLEIGGVGSRVGSGGMRTKVDAAHVVTASGGHVVVARASRPNVVADVVAGRSVGTHFVAATSRRDARRLWIGFALRTRGTLHVDAGAAEALTRRRTSLLAVGITQVDGDFAAGSCVAIVGPDKAVIGRGLVSFDAPEVQRVKGRPSAAVSPDGSGAPDRPVVHRDHLFTFST